MNMFEQIKSLFEFKLYEDVATLSSMVLTLCDHDPDCLSIGQKFQVLVYYGQSLYHHGEYKKAESIFRKSLQLRKMMNKAKAKAMQPDISSEVEVKFSLYQCYMHLKQTKEAIAILEGISSKFRTPKISMALAKLYQKTGMDRSAVTCYKEVLRECPLSLAAAQGLLSLDVKGPEVNTLMLHGMQGQAFADWLTVWLRAHSHGAAKDYIGAIHSLSSLDCKPILRDNADVLSSLGHMQFLQGQYLDAMASLQRAQSMDPFLLKNMDTLAYLLYKEKKDKELETLSNTLMATTKSAAEPWVAVGYYCMLTRRSSQAVYFAQKAFAADQQSVEALLMKGAALLELKKIGEAVMHYREAHRLAQHRYECYKGLVDCYLAGQKIREASTCATQAIQHLGTNARSLTLYATTLAKDPANIEKAKQCLEKALKYQSGHLEAVYLLADILLSQGQLEKGIELLRRQLKQQSTCRLHQMLGDFLSKSNDQQEALAQYNIALSLEPGNTRVREGMERVEKHGADLTIMDSTTDVDVENNSDETGLEGSDIESSAWSDIDLM